MLNALDVQAGWLGIETPEGPRSIRLATRCFVKIGGADFNIILRRSHTRKFISWIPQEQKLVAGDTLFRESMGRTDLPGGDTRKILSSIKTRLLPLPDNTVVFPGTARPPQSVMKRNSTLFCRVFSNLLIRFHFQDARDQFFCIRQALGNELDVHRGFPS